MASPSLDGENIPLHYVALGSSFAAGSGLGPRAPGSAVICLRTINSYPHHVARLCGLSLVSVACAGATAKHVLYGGPFRRPPQVAAIDHQTALVTLTIGGNDVGYSGDLIKMSHQARPNLAGFLLRRFWRGPKSVEQRPFSRLYDTLVAIFAEIGRRAPRARIIVVTYPALVPVSGVCPDLGITESEAALMRAVGDRLAEVTRAAAQAAGASVVDMATLSIGHDCCGPAPWVTGPLRRGGVPFHPTRAGTQATAQHIAQVLNAREHQPTNQTIP